MDILFRSVHFALGIGASDSGSILSGISSSVRGSSRVAKVGGVIHIRLSKLSLCVEVIHMCVVGEGRTIGGLARLCRRRLVEVLLHGGVGGLVGLLGLQLGVLFG